MTQRTSPTETTPNTDPYYADLSVGIPIERIVSVIRPLYAMLTRWRERSSEPRSAN